MINPYDIGTISKEELKMSDTYLLKLKYERADASLAEDVKDLDLDPYWMGVAEAYIYNEEDGELYCSITDIEEDEFAYFYMTDTSSFDQLKVVEPPEETLYFCDGYGEFFAEPESECKYKDVFRLLIYLCRSTEEERNKMIDFADGKCIHEIEIPVTDLEKDFSKRKIITHLQRMERMTD